jgi:NADPH-dependent curcumin reductase CurA
MRVALALDRAGVRSEYRALTAGRNRRFLLHERPAGRIGSNTFELSEPAATRGGIDVDFENVGGDIMDAVFAPLNTHTRCSLRADLRLQRCQPVARAARIRKPAHPARHGAGFIVLDHFGRATQASTEIAGLMAAGRLTTLETVVEGFEQLPTAINMLFDGKNVGKLVVKING